jgi:hypothetical protein
LTGTAGGATQPLTSGTPPLPGTGTPLPPVSVPGVQIPSLPDSQLPIDTSGVTKLLGG